ncbi:MAG: hypothetical protein E7D48_06945 [Bifidobacterium scardovii]|uniref:hypothetical protein n=1 Tax=Bifidobacterium scardovii TaxID=158787 RepID=UPI0028FED96C|nr:hypothetical protein [Bifidobacterium scardovii]MDU2421819.1 hypothetical protein [Bifidobacterium scardovii]
MRHYEHMLQVILDRELADQLDEANRKTMISKSRFVRYAIQPFSYAELSPAPADTDWNDVYRDDPDFDLSDGRRIAVLLTGDEYEMLCRASFKLGITRSAWVRERVYALLRRNYADELSSLTDAGIRDNATQLLKELKARTDGAPPSKKKEGRLPQNGRREHRRSPHPKRPPTRGKICMTLCTGLCAHIYIHIYTHIDIHIYIHMCIQTRAHINPMVSKLDGLYIQSRPAASRALRRWSNNPSAEGSIISGTRKEETDGEKKTKQAKRATWESGADPRR